ncbi:DNA-binding CsgD family transcriptional regulator [Rhizobium sp. AG855]|nr:DNA-binding CsgD family transcriptional regulator [Rhizobium sp. AG855]
MKMMMTDPQTALGQEPGFSLLTDREIRCLQLVAEGKRLEDAGNILVLSQEDVSHALASAQIKLEARNLFHAVSIAMLMGVIRHTDPFQPE